MQETVEFSRIIFIEWLTFSNFTGVLWHQVNGCYKVSTIPSIDIANYWYLTDLNISWFLKHENYVIGVKFSYPQKYWIVTEVYDSFLPLKDIDFLRLVYENSMSSSRNIERSYSMILEKDIEYIIRVRDGQLYLTLCDLVKQNRFFGIHICYVGEDLNLFEKSRFELIRVVYSYYK